MNKYNLDSSLRDLIANPKVIEDIFRERSKERLYYKISKIYIQIMLASFSQREYLTFKKANVLAKMTGRKKKEMFINI